MSLMRRKRHVVKTRVLRQWRRSKETLGLFRQNAHFAVLPLTLGVFAIFGGASGEAFAVHALLLLLAGLISAVCIIGMPLDKFPVSLRWPAVLLAAFLVLLIAQLVALPIDAWRALGGRQLIEDGWRLFDMAPSFDQVSVAPARTVSAMIYVLIPIAILLLVHRLGWRPAARYLPWVVAAIGAASAALGLAQVMMPSQPELYFYVYTNRGAPVGIFANVNNHAIFLLMTLAFTTVLLNGAPPNRPQTDGDTAASIIATLLAALQLIAILAAGSVAGYLLLIPTLALCFLMGQSERRVFKFSSLWPAILVLIPGILLVAYSPLLSGLGMTSITNDGPMSRLALAETGLQTFWDHFWLGTGLGTFEPVYKTYEDPDTVSLIYANHAHNDYLQWAIETGVTGVALLVLLLIWVLRHMIRVWRRNADSSTKIRRAAAIAVLVPMLHSFIEFPLRTPATLAFVSLCIALLIVPYAAPQRASSREKARLIKIAP